ncbi:FAD-dependent oxidoreductase [Alkalicaulis satelles]|nr:FAD-dependent oxidoreductase [Alkalicaulis satelles]
MMQRRAFLTLAAGAAAGAVLPFSARASGPAPSLPALDVHPGRIIRTVAGLRPFRAEGYVVRAERFSRRQTLVHHYGHGGAGVTMSWGTAAETVRVLESATSERSCAVIGSGVIGLTTALMLLRRGHQVTLYADALPPHTTSNIAGAYWGIASLYRRDAASPDFMARMRAAARYAHRAFQHLAGDPRYGVYWVRAFDLYDRLPANPASRPDMPELFPGFSRALGPDAYWGHSAVDSFHQLMIDPDIYLRALMADVENAGGRFAAARFEDARDVSRLRERVIVNCTGMGARALFGDEQLEPNRGQLTLLLPQPEIDYAYTTRFEGASLYMFPRRGALVLGGSHGRGDWSLEIDPAEQDRVLRGHGEMARAIAAG